MNDLPLVRNSAEVQGPLGISGSSTDLETDVLILDADLALTSLCGDGVDPKPIGLGPQLPVCRWE